MASGVALICACSFSCSKSSGGAGSSIHAELEWLERLEPLVRVFCRQGAVDVDRPGRARRQRGRRALEAYEVTLQVAGDLDLDAGVARVDRLLHLESQDIVGAEMAAGGVDLDLCFRFRSKIAGDRLPERQVLRLRPQIPGRRLDQADGARPLAVPAGLLVEHGDARAGRRVDEAVAIEQRLGLRLQQARNESLAQQRALAVAADGIERISRDSAVGDQRQRRSSHGAEADRGVAHVRTDADGALAAINKLHFVRGVRRLHGARPRYRRDPRA